MITAIDTSILLDVFAADPTYLAASSRALRDALSTGTLIACEVVWAEVGAFFPDADRTTAAMTKLGVEFSALDQDTSLMASRSWKKYRKHGGKRIRILPDFLIGAHALARADRFVTRDSGFYREYFTGLLVIDPND